MGSLKNEISTAGYGFGRLKSEPGRNRLQNIVEGPDAITRLALETA